MTAASNVPKKRIFYISRLAVAVLLAFFIVLSPENGREAAGYFFIAFYPGTCLLVFCMSGSWFYDGLLYGVFLLDALFIGIVMHLSGMADAPFLLACIALPCIAAFGVRVKYIVFGAVFAAGMYAWIPPDTVHPADTVHPGRAAAAGHYLIPSLLALIGLIFCFPAATVSGGNSTNRLRETERQYRLLFDSSNVFAFTVNRFGEFLSANPSLYLHHGFSDEIEILGISYAELTVREEADRFMAHLRTVFDTGNSIEYESFDPKRKKWYATTLEPVREPESDQVYAVGGVSRDITERVVKEVELRKAYDTLRETRDQLIQKDKMAALGRLASGIAHEIRNPMEIILMGIDFLENRIDASDTIGKQSLDRIYNAAERVNNIINDILKFSRKTAFDIEEVNVCMLVDDVLELAAHLTNKSGIRVITQIPAEAVMVAANRNMLEQVLLNLVHNAVDAMAATREKVLTIRVSLEAVRSVGYKTGYRKADYFRVGDSMVVIEVADTGKGMDKDVLTKLFEPFFTTKETGKGTGLGLSLALMIMDRMRGTIDVSSAPGEGSAFYVRLQPAGMITAMKEDDKNGFQDESTHY